MILLLPSEWITENNVMSQHLGSVLHAIFMTAYEEPLSENNKWWRVVKPEGFPWDGEILDFQSTNEKHNQLVAVFHKSETDSVIINAVLALGFENARSAKLTISPDTPAESPEVWYAGVKLNGTDVAVRTIAELTGHVKLSAQSIH